MDNFTLYLDLIQQSFEGEVKMTDKRGFQIPEMEEVLNMIDKKKIDIEPSKNIVKKIIDFAHQYGVIETEDEKWDLNLN
jgi:acetolactate synthase regulatory subunit